MLTKEKENCSINNMKILEKQRKVTSGTMSSCRKALHFQQNSHAGHQNSDEKSQALPCFWRDKFTLFVGFIYH